MYGAFENVQRISSAVLTTFLFASSLFAIVVVSTFYKIEAYTILRRKSYVPLSSKS